MAVLAPLKDQIVEAGNRILTEAHAIVKDASSRSYPFYKLYNFLGRLLCLCRSCAGLKQLQTVSLSLSFRLESLHTQAQKLSRDVAYRGNISVELSRDRKSLEVSYWM